jgi:hypothetical protein
MEGRVNITDGALGTSGGGGADVARAVATIANAITAVCTPTLISVPPVRRACTAWDSSNVRNIVAPGLVVAHNMATRARRCMTNR